jgi:hypothetical protein
MSTPIQNFLACLEGVKPRQRGGWSALCPAHNDRTPSLIVDVADDGRLLIHCFAACGAGDVVAALGLSLSDLFDNRDGSGHSRAHQRRRPVLTGRDVLDMLDRERLVVLGIAAALAGGGVPTADDLARLADASRRLERVREVTG